MSTENTPEEHAAAPPGPAVQTLAVDHGAITECPVWESHRRGRNWAATIAVNPAAPGGLDRTFWTKGHGADHFYLVPSSLRIGDAVEFAGDYVTGGAGNRIENRRYRTVTGITADTLTMTCHDTARQAIDAGAALLTEIVGAPLDALHDTAARVLADLNGTVTEPGQSWYAEPKRFGPATRRTGKLAEIRFRLLTDAAARDAGLLD